MVNSIDFEIYPAYNFTIVDILTFVSRINTTSVSFEARKIFISILIFISNRNFVFISVDLEKSFIIWGPGLEVIKL